MSYQILVINPGGGSTRVALFRDEKRYMDENIQHPSEELSRFPKILDQYEYRKEAILNLLKDRRVSLEKLSCVVGRGGPFKPLESGTYRVTHRVIEDIRKGRVQSEHPSLLGALIAKDIADPLNIPAFFVDPVSVDEFWELSRYSGLKEIRRKALSHALSVKMAAKEAAKRLKKSYKRCNFIVVHLGTGITVAAHLKGRQVDANNANEDGPFSPQRTGSLPLPPLVELCYKYSKEEILKKIQRKGGLLSYLGTDDIREIEKRIEEGDEEAEMVYEAMVYQIAKEIGAYAVVLKGKIDAIVITGGMAHSKRLIRSLRGWIGFLSKKIFVFPGEREMEALAKGALRVLKGEENEKTY